MIKHKLNITLFISCFLLLHLAIAQEKNKLKTNGFVDFNGYYDTRNFSVFTINTLANLTDRVQYFSFINYQSGYKTLEFSSFYAEHNIRWKIKKESALDVTFQSVMRQVGNTDFQLGVRWRVGSTKKLAPFFKKINLFYSINPMLVRFKWNSPVQAIPLIEHFYTLKLWKNRIYISGFADQNFIYSNNKLTLKWVTEHQIGVRIIDNFYIVAEYRINEFLPSQPNGLGYGLEYKIRF